MEGGHRLPFAGPAGARGCQELIRHAEEQGQPSATLQAAGDQAKWDVVGFCPFAACVTPQWPPPCSGMSCLEPALSVCPSSPAGQRRQSPWSGGAGGRVLEEFSQDLKSWSLEEGRAGRGRQGMGRDAGWDEGKRGGGERCCGHRCQAMERLEGLSSTGTLLSPAGAPTLCWILLGSLRCCGWDLPG